MAKQDVHDHGRELAASARLDLESHRDTGEASIELQLTATDAVVSLADPDGGEMAIEYGRGEYLTADGRLVGAMEGLHILGKLL
jgi:hypothetical protein